MKVYTKCPKCGADYSEKTLCDTRGELAMEKGNSFEVVCSQCQEKFEVHVNDLRAGKSLAAGLAALIVLGISLPFSIIMFLQIGWALFTYLSVAGLIVLPSIIYVIINKQETNRIKAFNRLTVKR